MSSSTACIFSKLPKVLMLDHCKLLQFCIQHVSEVCSSPDTKRETSNMTIQARRSFSTNLESVIT